MKKLARSLTMLLVAAPSFAQIQWPLEPGDARHPIGNNYGAFQSYDGATTYVHDGLDILAPSSSPVYAVEAGTVTHITSDDIYTGIMVGQPTSQGRGYLYWHLDPDTLAFEVGDTVAEGDYLGDVIDWPVPGFAHVHFSLVRGTGGYPWQWYESTGNPLLSLAANDDDIEPTIERTNTGEALLLCGNESSSYLRPTSLSGEVDIVLKAFDLIEHQATWRLVPLTIEWEVRNNAGVSVARMPPFRFDGEFPDINAAARVIYKDDRTADSAGNYSRRDFFFVVTNSDGDSVIEQSDKQGAWDTTELPNGDYTIIVRVADHVARAAEVTMPVKVNN